jgi:RNA polymerase sigma-70 factor (ECF subfamily)
MCHVELVAGMQRELVKRAIEGDHEAFTTLANGSVDRLYAIARLILRDGDRAQDAVQEAMVSAWRDLRSLRDPGAWDAWLYRLTVWACYRQARKDRRRTVVELHVMPDPEMEPIADLGSSIVDRDRLDRQLGRLPIDQRAVIVLHFYLGRPLTEAAGILGVPVGTAKSRLNRGLQAMRDGMRDEPEAVQSVRMRTA